LGSEAINALLEGQKLVTVGIVCDKVVYTSFEHAIEGKKSVSESLIKLAEILSI
jgi:hypothetical protein